jgi:membrane-associated phospholipid phosphatase
MLDLASRRTRRFPGAAAHDVSATSIPGRGRHRVHAVLLGAALIHATPPRMIAQETGVRDSAAVDARADDAEGVFSRRMLFPLGAAVVATIVIAPFDRPIQSALQNHTLQRSASLHGAADVLAYAGAQGPFLLGGTSFAVGRVFGVERLADLGLHLTEGAALASAIGALGKGIAGRALPDVPPTDGPGDFSFGRGFHAKSGHYVSFPAGHCAVSFASAAVLTSEAERWRPGLGWKVGTAAYGAATLVALARMYQNRHWASDNPLGVAIGTWSGLTVLKRQHRGPRTMLDRWLLGLSAAPTSQGGFIVSWSPNDLMDPAGLAADTTR